MSMYRIILIGVIGIASCRTTVQKSSAKDIGGGSTSISGMNFISFPGQSFAMQETEVTRGQWKALMGDYPEAIDASCKPKVPSDDHPVVCVSARDAERFADEMTRKNDGYTFRLPSEQEWATAAGNIEGPVYGWCNGDSIHPVKKLMAQNGLYDMVGNVWEWTSSNWDSSSSFRVMRGGSWGSIPKYCRVSTRSYWRPDKRIISVGFRLLMQQ
jgi:formylglycine-generating enzyme required for sulfatase activity